MSRHLAIDIGASGGKAFIGEFKGGAFNLVEIYRFPNGPVEFDGRLRWDIKALIEGVRDCIRTALDYCETGLDSIGIDTWGVDFGFLDDDGNLIADPFAYRDPIVSSTVDAVFKLIPRDELFARTGIQHLPFNTIFQLHSFFKNPSEYAANLQKMLLMPGLLTYLAGGNQAVDVTIASTTQLIDIQTGEWAYDIAERLNIPVNILPGIVPAGIIAGDLGGPIGVGLDPSSRMVHTAGHDTAAAVAAFDFGDEDAAYLSTGTWFLAGCLSDKPLLSGEAYAAGLTNERAADGRFRILKNITGLYLMEECRRQWTEEGKETDVAKLIKMAARAKPFGALIDPDDPSFAAIGDMPAKIAYILQKTNQQVPSDAGGLLRCIFESIAIKTALVLERIFNVAGINPKTLHLGGGGARNELLCHMIANATGLKVIAGPIEAAAVGNIIVQAVALGEIPSIAEGAGIVARSLPMKTYAPEDKAAWADAKERFSSMFGNNNETR